MANDYSSNIWKIYLYQFIGHLELSAPIFVLFFLSTGLTMTQTMILQSIFTFGWLALEIPSGAFADRFGRKTALIISECAIFISCLLWGLGSTFFVFLIAQIILSFNWAMGSGTKQAFLYDSLKEIKREKEYAKVFGISSAIQNFTVAGAAVLGGTLAVITGYRFLFFVSAFFFLIGLFIIFTFKEPPIHKHLQQKNYMSHITNALKFSWDNNIVRSLIIYFSFFSAIGFMIYFIIQPYFGFSSLPAYFVGIAAGIFALGKGIGNMLAKKAETRNPFIALIFIIIVCSISLMCLNFISGITALFFIIICALALGAKDIIVQDEINKHTDSYHRATVLSIMSMTFGLMYTIFAPFVGLIVDAYTPAAAFFMMGVGLFAHSIWAMIVFLKLRKNKIQ